MAQFAPLPSEKSTDGLQKFIYYLVILRRNMTKSPLIEIA